MPDRDDIGAHTMLLNVSDPAGASDFQELKVFVDDRPEAYLEGYNLFDDIADIYASVEDPYILNATKTKVVYSHGPLEYRIYDPEDPLIIDWSTDPEMTVPSNYSSLDSVDSWPSGNGFFKNPSPAKDSSVLHEITLEVRKRDLESSFAELKKQVEVFRCLPHRSSSPSWPFNEFKTDRFPDDEKNPFMANHTCCGDGTDGYSFGDVKPDNQTCYNDRLYGCYWDLDDDNKNYDDLLLKSALPGGFIPAVPDDRDLFMIEVTSFCDGIHGNGCDVSNTDYTIERLTRCPVCQHCEWGSDHCMNDSWYEPCDDVWRCSPMDSSPTPGGGYGAGGEWCCQGGCDITGTLPSCSRGINCFYVGPGCSGICN